MLGGHARGRTRGQCCWSRVRRGRSVREDASEKIEARDY